MPISGVNGLNGGGVLAAKTLLGTLTASVAKKNSATLAVKNIENSENRAERFKYFIQISQYR